MFMSLRAVLARVLPLLVLFAPAASAQTTAPPRGDLTLAQALDAALRSNPNLRASGWEISAAQARRVQAALRPNPELALELENFAGSGAARGTDALETTLSLSQVIELGGKRGLRRDVAAFALDDVTLEQRLRELDVLADVTRRFIDVAVAQERERFTAEALELMRHSADSIDARARAGRTPQAEVSRARVAALRTTIERDAASVALAAARQALSATWGDDEPVFGAAQARLFDLTAIEPLEAALARLENGGDLQRFVSLSRQHEAELRLARIQSRPNLVFSVGVRRFEQSGDHALVAGFSMPLAINDRNTGAIGEARARVARTAAEREAARIRARATLRSLYLELAATRARVEILERDAIPGARQALEQTRSGYDRGRFSFLELASIQEELLGLRSASIDAAADYHRLLAEIERLTGAAATTQLPGTLP